MRKSLSSIVLVLLLSGCTQLQTFRVVDSQSGQPIEGVQVERLRSSIEPSSMPFVLFKSLSPVEKQTTDESGVSTFKEPGTQAILNPDGKNPAYNKAYVTTTWSGVKVLYPDDYREISVKPVDGVVEIPLPSRRLAKPVQHQHISGLDDREAECLERGDSDMLDRDNRLTSDADRPGRDKLR